MYKLSQVAGCALHTGTPQSSSLTYINLLGSGSDTKLIKVEQQVRAPYHTNFPVYLSFTVPLNPLLALLNMQLFFTKTERSLS